MQRAAASLQAKAHTQMQQMPLQLDAQHIHPDAGRLLPGSHPTTPLQLQSAHSAPVFPGLTAQDGLPPGTGWHGGLQDADLQLAAMASLMGVDSVQKGMLVSPDLAVLRSSAHPSAQSSRRTLCCAGSRSALGHALRSRPAAAVGQHAGRLCWPAGCGSVHPDQPLRQPARAEQPAAQAQPGVHSHGVRHPRTSPSSGAPCTCSLGSLCSDQQPSTAQGHQHSSTRQAAQPPCSGALLGDCTQELLSARPDFAVVYAFLGSLFDNALESVDHVKMLYQDLPVQDRRTVQLLLGNLTAALRRPDTSDLYAKVCCPATAAGAAWTALPGSAALSVQERRRSCRSQCHLTSSSCCMLRYCRLTALLPAGSADTAGGKLVAHSSACSGPGTTARVLEPPAPALALHRLAARQHTRAAAKVPSPKTPWPPPRPPRSLLHWCPRVLTAPGVTCSAAL